MVLPRTNQEMVDTLFSPAERISSLYRAMCAVDRGHFVPRGAWDPWAYDPAQTLPIGKEQTISRPSTVRRLTALLGPLWGKNVIEVGLGTGYQAAVLARLVGQKGSVQSYDIHSDLVDGAVWNLRTSFGAWPKQLSVGCLDGIEYILGGERLFDRILVSCEMPQRFDGSLFDAHLDQRDGVAIYPQGGVYRSRVISQGILKTAEHEGTRFVPCVMRDGAR